MASLKEIESLDMELRLQDSMLLDCMEVIQRYQYVIEVKLFWALMSQRDEKDEQQTPYSKALSF
jgi:hypothetical protein